MSERDAIAEAQAKLAAALTNGKATPEGFDAEQVSRAGAVLMNKRRAGLRFYLPELVEALGEEFEVLVARFAKESDWPEDSLKDAARFGEWIQQLGRFPETARREFIRVQLREGRHVVMGRGWIGVRVGKRIWIIA